MQLSEDYKLIRFLFKLGLKEAYFLMITRYEIEVNELYFVLRGVSD